MDATDTRDELDHLVLHDLDDVRRMWELLMQPLGFRSTSLWVTFVGPDRRPTRFLIEVSDHDVAPTEPEVAHLCSVLEQVLRSEGPGCTAAFLVTRPGRAGPTSLDRLFARRLTAGARLAGVPLEPVHLANDVLVMPLTPDG